MISPCRRRSWASPCSCRPPWSRTWRLHRRPALRPRPRHRTACRPASCPCRESRLHTSRCPSIENPRPTPASSTRAHRTPGMRKAAPRSSFATPPAHGRRPRNDTRKSACFTPKIQSSFTQPRGNHAVERSAHRQNGAVVPRFQAAPFLWVLLFVLLVFFLLAFCRFFVFVV